MIDGIKVAMKHRNRSRRLVAGIGVALFTAGVGVSGHTLAVGTATPRLAAQAGQAAGAATALGAIRIPRAARADGKPLPAGTYQLRLTAEEARPPAAGQTPSYERWVEFVQGGQVRGREVVTVGPQSDIAGVADMTPPPPGGQRVEMLKGDEYLRVWLNRGGQHYLIHLAI